MMSINTYLPECENKGRFSFSVGERRYVAYKFGELDESRFWWRVYSGNNEDHHILNIVKDVNFGSLKEAVKAFGLI